ncbi:nucleotidyltransferase domain-containing protein [Peribacillus sp. NPDC076916]|uniref:nucleotidyltransferase domain-containing protein n=1 Tax=Peribacillus sp. NPDC076916 TaxID=3390608 RepID=UPI003D02B8A0
MNKNFSLDLTEIPRELKLILEILKGRNDERIILNKCYTDINWAQFLEIANHHRVYPLVFSQIKKKYKDLVPLSVFKSLQQEYKKNTYQMLQLSGEMELVSTLFNENKIRLLFLKGPVIAQELFGDISLRTSKDLDILISISDLKKAESLLLNCGYQKEEKLYILNEWKWRTHHISYYNPKKQIQIEIHWRLNPFPSNEPSFNNLWRRRRRSGLTTAPIYYLGNEDLFSYLITHGARHGWFRLRWLIDIDQMVLKGLNTEKIIFSLKKYKYNFQVGQALILSSQLLDTPVTKEFEKLTKVNNSIKLAQESICFICEKSQFKYPQDYMNAFKTEWQKFISIVMLIYPRYIDALTLRLPRPLHFLYFPLRPFIWIWRKRRKFT